MTGSNNTNTSGSNTNNTNGSSNGSSSSSSNGSSSGGSDFLNFSGISLNVPSIPKYHYPYFVSTPFEANTGMKIDGNDLGNLQTIGGNMGAILEYIEILTMGETSVSKANNIQCSYGSNGTCIGYPSNKGGAPLGNAYFYDTSFQCTDSTGQKQNVSMYVNNIPTGHIPFMPGGGVLKGLIPGILENVFNLNPQDIISAFEVNSDTSCVEVFLPTSNIDDTGTATNKEGPIINGPYSKDSTIPRRFMYPQFSADIFNEFFYTCPESKNWPSWQKTIPKVSATISGYDISVCSQYIASNCNPTPSSFGGWSGVGCSTSPTENFTNIDNNQLSTFKYSSINFSQEDTLIHIYFIAISILFLFILLKLLYKNVR